MLARKELDQAGLDLLETANIKEQRGHKKMPFIVMTKKTYAFMPLFVRQCVLTHTLQ